MDSPKAPKLTEHIEDEPRLPSRAETQTPSFSTSLIDHGQTYQGPAIQPCCGKRHGQPFAHRGELVCLICKTAKNKRRAYRDWRSGICRECSARLEAESDATWAAKSESEHAADGDALFESMARRRS